MGLKTGDRLRFDDLGVEVIVTAGGDGEVTAALRGNAQLLAGKRFKCETTGVQVLVIKPGTAELHCNGVEMVAQEPKKTKAAD